MRQRPERDERDSAIKKLFRLMTGSLACIHLLTCAWYYLGSRHADWQQASAKISWLHVEELYSQITYGRSLWGMQEHALPWERLVIIWP